MAEPAADIIWRRTLRRYMRNYAILAAILLAWIGLGAVGLLGTDLRNSGVLIVAVVLYVLALPTSLFLHLESVTARFGYESNVSAQLIALAYVGLNFFILGLLHGFYRQWKRKLGAGKTSEEKQKGAGPTSLNGAGTGSSEPH